MLQHLLRPLLHLRLKTSKPFLLAEKPTSVGFFFATREGGPRCMGHNVGMSERVIPLLDQRNRPAIVPAQAIVPNGLLGCLLYTSPSPRD